MASRTRAKVRYAGVAPDTAVGLPPPADGDVYALIQWDLRRRFLEAVDDLEPSHPVRSIGPDLLPTSYAAAVDALTARLAGRRFVDAAREEVARAIRTQRPQDFPDDVKRVARQLLPQHRDDITAARDALGMFQEPGEIPLSNDELDLIVETAGFEGARRTAAGTLLELLDRGDIRSEQAFLAEFAERYAAHMHEHLDGVSRPASERDRQLLTNAYLDAESFTSIYGGVAMQSARPVAALLYAKGDLNERLRNKRAASDMLRQQLRGLGLEPGKSAFAQRTTAEQFVTKREFANHRMSDTDVVKDVERIWSRVMHEFIRERRELLIERKLIASFQHEFGDNDVLSLSRSLDTQGRVEAKRAERAAMKPPVHETDFDRRAQPFQWLVEESRAYLRRAVAAVPPSHPVHFRPFGDLPGSLAEAYAQRDQYDASQGMSWKKSRELALDRAVRRRNPAGLSQVEIDTFERRVREPDPLVNDIYALVGRSASPDYGQPLDDEVLDRIVARAGAEGALRLAAVAMLDVISETSVAEGDRADLQQQWAERYADLTRSILWSNSSYNKAAVAGRSNQLRETQAHRSDVEAHFVQPVLDVLFPANSRSQQTPRQRVICASETIDQLISPLGVGHQPITTPTDAEILATNVWQLRADDVEWWDQIIDVWQGAMTDFVRDHEVELRQAGLLDDYDRETLTNGSYATTRALHTISERLTEGAGAEVTVEL